MGIGTTCTSFVATLLAWQEETGLLHHSLGFLLHRRAKILKVVYIKYIYKKSHVIGNHYNVFINKYLSLIATGSTCVLSIIRSATFALKKWPAQVPATRCHHSHSSEEIIRPKSRPMEPILLIKCERNRTTCMTIDVNFALYLKGLI